MRKHPVIYALPLVFLVVTVLVLGLLQLAGAECYSGVSPDAAECNDLGTAARAFLAPGGFALAALSLIVLVWRELFYAFGRR